MKTSEKPKSEMTMLEYYAGQALFGILASQSEPNIPHLKNEYAKDSLSMAESLCQKLDQWWKNMV